MPTLEEQLLEVLPKVLPDNPDDSINGTDLLEKVRSEGLESFKDNSIRQYFSDLSGDPTTPIAKVDQGYGYYLRRDEADEVDEKEGENGSGTREKQEEEKFRAIFMRYEEMNNRYPVKIDHVRGKRRRSGVNKWKFPDAVVLAWEVGEAAESGYRINKDLLEVKRSVGDPPFRISSVELKVRFSYSTFREYFFQCVSNSKWANHSRLVVANEVADETLAEELRRLGSSYNVSVISYGLDSDYLGDLPMAGKIREMEDEQFDSIADKIEVKKLVTSEGPEPIDWQHIDDMRTQSPELDNIFEWIAECLEERKPFYYDDYMDISEIQNRVGT